MPETPETQGIIIDEGLPVPQGVPLREGEEKYAATLNLEHQRRRDSEIDELRREIQALKGVSGPYRSNAESPAEKARRNMIKEKVRDLYAATEQRGDTWYGPCAPATIINFNPVTLRLKGILASQSVHAAGIGRKVTIPYRGRKWVGSYVTSRSPVTWPICIGTENVKGIDVPSFKAEYISPIGIAHQFYEHYVVGARDAEGMGGILIFAGDAHTLEPARQAKSNGTLMVPIPDPELSTHERVSFKLEMRSLDACLDRALATQRAYAEWQISEGHRFANAQSDDLRSQLSSYHILWHNWAIEMGYKREPEKWAAAQLQDSPDVDAIFCPGCHTRQTNTEQAFCPNCNRPFDAYKAFMAGHPVPMQYLEMYEGAEWDGIVVEMKRRKEKRAMLEGVEEPKKKVRKADEKDE